MDFILKKLFSMQATVLGLLAFALAVAVATFIENDYGTDTAKAMVYNAAWFELLLLFLTANLLVNMKRFNMHKAPFAMKTIFHASFVLILIGAAVTRYFGYEGTLHIREGHTENKMLSDRNYIEISLSDGNATHAFEKTVLFSKLSSNRFDQAFDAGDETLNVELLEYIPSAALELVEDPNGESILQMMIVGANGGEEVLLKAGQTFETAHHLIRFESTQASSKPVIDIYRKEGALLISHDAPLYTMSMDTKEEKNLPASKISPLERRMLNKVGESTFVLKGFYEKAVQKLVSKEAQVRNQSGSRNKDALKLRAVYKGKTADLTVFGNSGALGMYTQARLGDAEISVRYGAKLLELPFAVHLVDFELERYPGSMAPSSYASEVVLLDPEHNLKMPYRIYMNHVLDHRGFRLFQASYDTDELGTVLSVNYDFWGTWITYVGYILLGIGFFGSFVVKGRFLGLRKKLEELAVKRQAVAALLAAALLGFSTPAIAEEGHEGHNHAPGEHPQEQTMTPQEAAKTAAIHAKHAAQFGRLLTQTADGRLKPVDSLAREIMAKVVKKSSLLGLDSNQIIIGMMTQPQLWSQVPMIKLGNSEIAKLLHLDPKEKYAAFTHFYPMDLGDTYVLEHYVNDARRKPPKERNDMDKALLKVDEAVHICRMVYTGILLNIFPRPNDATQKWSHLVESMQTFDQPTAMDIRNRFLAYFQGIDEGLNSGNWEGADIAVEGLKSYQKTYGSAIYPSDFVITLEILYNKLALFEWLMVAFLIIGAVMLVVAFIKILKPKAAIHGVTRYSFYALVVLFGLYTLGLAMRWIISGHAPWSNGYEALVYIGWSTMVAGFLVSRNSPLTLAATAMLTGITLFVAMISSFDPQITNLVPVLKSYWLTIHVSMITASYGFLGLAALLGFIALVLFVMLNPQNSARLSLSIKELNIVSEMAILMGLVLLTVGNFLGGVWANESWGRYWGWDAKEAWALVSILVYAALSHIRYIPKFYTDFRFAAFSLVSFSSILMTFFGVNYYLSGLHSYAKGDPVPVPSWVYVAVVMVAVLIVAAWSKKRHFTK